MNKNSDKPKSRNPYHSDSGEPELKLSVIVLMDILGYRDLTREAKEKGTQQKLLVDLFEALSESRNWLDGDHLKDKMKFSDDVFAIKAFTDNIVLGFPIHDDGESELGYAFSKAAEFQFNMAIKGFFVRGAITVGAGYVDEIVVGGDALTEAYEIETSRARDPRIVLSGESIDLIKEHMGYYGNPSHSPQARDLLQDSDGQWFVNYLDEVLIAEDEHGPFYEEFLMHKSAVEEKLKLYKNNPPIFSKYAWVAGYHNFFCEMHPEHFSDRHTINTDLFRAKPRRIVG